MKRTGKSTRVMAAELTRRGHPVTWRTVARCVLTWSIHCKPNRKTVEGGQHPDRDAQFRYINARVELKPHIQP